MRGICLVLGLAAAVLPARGLYAQTSIQVTPNPVVVHALVGAATNVSQTFSLVNAGAASGAQVTYVILPSSSKPSWLVYPGESGTLTGTTPATITVTVNPTGLQAGTYNTTLQVTVNGAGNSPLSVPLTLNVSELTASPAVLPAFVYVAGGAIPAAQLVTVSGNTAVNFTASVSTASGGSWLQVAPTSATVPAAVSVSLNSQVVPGLSPATYTGTLHLAPKTGSTPGIDVPVTLVVSAQPEVSVSPSSLQFKYQTGGTKNVTQQSVSVTSNGIPVTFTVEPPTVDPNPIGSVWLTVTNSGNVTPATLSVGIVPGALPPGTYTGKIELLLSGASQASVTIPVSMTVSVNPLITAAPATLAFTWQNGATAPAAQSVTFTSTGADVNYTASVLTSDGNPWLSATSNGTTASPLSIAVSPSGLGVGSYTGTVVITLVGAGNVSPISISVSLKVTNDPIPVIQSGPLYFAYQTGHSAPGGISLPVTSSTGAPLNFTVSRATSGGGSWLHVNPAAGTTPSSFTVTVSTAGLEPGTYEGDVTVSATNAATGAPAPATASVHVKYYVAQTALLVLSTSGSTPNLLAFTSVAGSSPAAQTITAGSTNPTQDNLIYTATFAPSPGVSPWATLNTSSGTGTTVMGTTPGILNVTVNPLLLSAGVYTGTITFTAKSMVTGEEVANDGETVNLTLQVAAATIKATPQSLSFQQAGSSAPAAQTLAITTTPATATPFTATAATDVAVQWLKINTNSGTTPANLSVTVDGSQLSPGTYHGTITIATSGAAGSPIAVPVSFTVSSVPALSLTPATLAFTYDGSTVPAAKTVRVSAGSPVDFTVQAATTSGGPWLKVTPATGTTPKDLSISIDPTNLAVGNYTGTVTVTSPSASNSPQKVDVTLAVQVALPVATAVTNAASFATGKISPGEVITIWGTNLGPSTPATLAIGSNGKVTTTLSDTQVMFDGVGAPLTYVSTTQINAVVPYELAGRTSTNMTVIYKGQPSAALNLALTDTAPGIFTLGGQQGAILNYNSGPIPTVNSATNPARRGSVIAIYATGEGQTNPAGVTGRIVPINGTGLSKPRLDVKVLIGGEDAEVAYAGNAPGTVAGVLQVNAIVPIDAQRGGAVPVLIIIGGAASSQANVTMGVQ